jgi:hypothetical protein
VTESPAAATATQVVTQLVDGLTLAGAAGVFCTGLDAYLLSGYVRFDTSNNPTGEEPGNAGTNNETLPLDAVTPLSLDTSNNPTPNSGGTPAMTCYSQRQKVVATSPSPVTITSVSRSGTTVTVNAPGHAFTTGNIVAINAVSPPAFNGAYRIQSVGAGTFTYTLPPPPPSATGGTGGSAVLVQRLTIPESTTVTGYSTIVSKFVSYACIVTPVNHDAGDPGEASTPLRWWGRVTINANSNTTVGPVWQIGTANGQYKVCRYSADWNGDNKISNSEHPRWYRPVTGALDSQNYLVILSSEDCPTDRAQSLFTNPVNFADDTTAGHQPASIQEWSFQCLTSACSGGNKQVRENTSNTFELTMD